MHTLFILVTRAVGPSSHTFHPSHARCCTQARMPKRTRAPSTAENILVMDCTEPCEPTAYTVRFSTAPTRMQCMLRKKTKFWVAEEEDLLTHSGLVDTTGEDSKVIEEDVHNVMDFLEKATNAENETVFPQKHCVVIFMHRG